MKQYQRINELYGNQETRDEYIKRRDEYMKASIKKTLLLALAIVAITLIYTLTGCQTDKNYDVIDNPTTTDYTTPIY